MKNLLLRACIAALVAVALPLALSTPAAAQTTPTTFSLLKNGTSLGAQSVDPGSYAISFPTAFNGATITVTVTDSSGNTQVSTYTSAPGTPSILNIYSGSTVSASASGGVPTGTLKINGGPTSGASITGGGDASAANQNTGNTSLALIQAEIGAISGSPTANTLQARLEAIRAAVAAQGTPFHAGDSIGNTTFASTVADGANVTLGAKADAKNCATDTTAVSEIATLKCQVDRLQALVNALGAPYQAGGALPLPSGAATQTTLAAVATNTTPAIFYNGAGGTGSLLASSATFTGAARDVGVAQSTAHPYAYFNAFFLTDQAGTGRIDCSNDGTTWYTCASNAITAATPLTLTVPVMTRYHRAVVVNGATAETFLWVNSAYTGG